VGQAGKENVSLKGSGGCRIFFRGGLTICIKHATVKGSTKLPLLKGSTKSERRREEKKRGGIQNTRYDKIIKVRRPIL